MSVVLYGRIARSLSHVSTARVEPPSQGKVPQYSITLTTHHPHALTSGIKPALHPQLAQRLRTCRSVMHLRFSLGPIDEVFQFTTQRSSCKQFQIRNVQHELEVIQTQVTQKPVLRAEVGMRARCANKTSAE